MDVKKSTQKDKKLMAIFTDDKGKVIKTTHFGAVRDGKPMDDYTITGDKEARKRYRERHAKDLKTNDPKRAGFLSRFILWGDSTSREDNIKAYKKRFGFS